jgi:hypothetical protein
MWLAELAAQPEAGEDRVVAVDVIFAEVAEMSTALTYEHEEASSRVVVVPMLPQMIGERNDAIRQECDLHFWRPGITGGSLELGDDLLFAFGCLHRRQF